MNPLKSLSLATLLLIFTSGIPVTLSEDEKAETDSRIRSQRILSNPLVIVQTPRRGERPFALTPLIAGSRMRSQRLETPIIAQALPSLPLNFEENQYSKSPELVDLGGFTSSHKR